MNSDPVTKTVIYCPSCKHANVRIFPLHVEKRRISMDEYVKRSEYCVMDGMLRHYRYRIICKHCGYYLDFTRSGG